MNNKLVINSVRFISLFILQLFVLDKMVLCDFIVPMCYVLFIVLYPVDNEKWLFLGLSFLLGLSLDIFQDSGGAHAAAAVTIAFIRPFFLRIVYGESYIMKNIKVSRSSWDRWMLLLVLLILVHHLIYFSLIIFNTSQILYVLSTTLFTSIATLLISAILILIFKPRRER